MIERPENLTESLSFARSIDDVVAEPHSRDRCSGPARVESSPRITEGARLGRYMILRVLGEGGMGVVYVAHDPELEREVAIKIVRVRPNAGAEARLAYQARLLDEGKAMARLAHPNVVTVYDVGVVGELVFVTMELVEGPTLKTWLQERPRTWREILELFIVAGQGLAAAHAVGLVHRDFKPSNVLVAGGVSPRIADFGLARPSPSDEPDSGDAGGRRPRAAAVQGTRHYMSPEQARGELVDARSDQYSFCLALWESVFGRLPAATEVARSAMVNERGRGPRWLRQALERGLAREPVDRWPSMSALLGELERGRTQRGRLLGLGSLVAAALLGFGASSVNRGAPRPATVCAELEAQLDRTWGPERRAGLTTILKGAGEEGVEIRAELAERVHAGIEAYAEGWSRQYRSSCEAHARGEQSDLGYDRQLRCLDDRRIALDAALGLFEEGQPSILARGPEIIGALPSLTDCEDAEALATGYPEPIDPTLAARVRALDAQLTALLPMLISRDVRRATPRLEELGPEVEALDHPPLTARFESYRAKLAGVVANVQVERAASERSVHAALLAGDDEAAVRALKLLVSPEPDRKPGEVEVYVALGQTLIQRAGLEDTCVAIAFDFNRAGIHRAAVDLDQLDRFAERTRAALADEPALCLSLLSAVAMTAQSVNATALATKLSEEVFASTEDLLGEAQATAWGLDLQAAAVLERAGDYAAAEAKLNRGLRVVEALGLGSAERLARIEQRAVIYEQQGRFEDALADLRSIHELVGGDLSVAVTSNNAQAVILDRIGRYDEAREHLEAGLAAIADQPGRAFESHVMLLSLADVELHSQSLDVARELYERGGQWFTTQFGARSSMSVYADNGLALVELAEGDPEGAQTRFEQVLVLRRELGVGVEEVAATQFGLARALSAQAREPERAKSLAREALSVYESLGPGYRGEAEEVRAWLRKREVL